MLLSEDRMYKGCFPYEPKPRDGMVHNDHLVTPHKMTDSTGAVVWSAYYKPFGAATVTVSTITNNLRFPGQYFDVETGLNDNYFRDYNPVIGKYIEADPVGIQSGKNQLYTYVRNSPLNWFDPNGQEPASIITAGAWVILGGIVVQQLNQIYAILNPPPTQNVDPRCTQCHGAANCTLPRVGSGPRGGVPVYSAPAPYPSAPVATGR